jgi:hypothetical protein
LDSAEASIDIPGDKTRQVRHLPKRSTMKKAFALVILLAMSLAPVAQGGYAEARTAQLHSLACTAVNGITIKTIDKTQAGILVASNWGPYQKTFEARVALGTNGTESHVHLLNDAGQLEYMISLILTPELSKLQVSDGVLLGPSLRPGTMTTPIAAIRCKVQLK